MNFNYQSEPLRITQETVLRKQDAGSQLNLFSGICQTQKFRNMRTNKKEIAASIYLTVSLFALCGEPTGEKSMSFYISYYIFWLVNLAIAVVITNKLYGKHEITRNRNRVQKRTYRCSRNWSNKSTYTDRSTKALSEIA